MLDYIFPESHKAGYSDYCSLIELIIKASNAYYNNDSSFISDTEFDTYFQLLKEYESLHPERISLDSPTQNLHHQASKIDAFTKAKHKIPLLSLENSYTSDDIIDWFDSCKRNLEKIDTSLHMTFSVEPKYDGISVELIYKEWKFVQAITRWDGIIWEDITNNALQITSIPKSIPYQEDLSVRWEIMMPKSAFEQLNIERTQKWEPLFANPRNAVSGTMKQLDSSIVAERSLICYVYDIL